MLVCGRRCWRDLTTADVLCKAVKKAITVHICAATAIFVTTIDGLGIALAAFTVGKTVENAIVVDVSTASAFVITTIGCPGLAIKATFIISKPVEDAIIIDVETALPILIKAIGLVSFAGAERTEHVVAKHMCSLALVTGVKDCFVGDSCRVRC